MAVQNGNYGIALDLIDTLMGYWSNSSRLALYLFEQGRTIDLLADVGLGKISTASEELFSSVVNDYPNSVFVTPAEIMLSRQSVYFDIGNNEIPRTFKLKPVYPNPFNPSITIPYDIPKTSDCNVTVYNMLGREVWSHRDYSKPAGVYSINWNGKHNDGRVAASGIYLISFSTEEFRAVQKAVLIR